jgi:pyruvate carboxylase
LALHLVAMDVDPADFEANPGAYDIPDSVVGFMAGELGDLPGGWPEPFRSKILEGKTRKPSLTELTTEQEEALAHPGRERQEMLNTLLFPGPTSDYREVHETYGDVSVIKTRDYLYGLPLGEESVIEIEPGVSLYVSLESISEPDDKGMRTVMASLNGQMRPIAIRDRSIDVQVSHAEKADPQNPRHVAAPFSGVVTVVTEVGESVTEGHVVATIEAMKMEAGISSAVSGVVSRWAIPRTQQVEAGDLILEVAPD